MVFTVILTALLTFKAVKYYEMVKSDMAKKGK